MQHLNPAARCARMGAVAELPVSRFLHAVNDFDLPRHIRYAHINSSWIYVARSVDALLSLFINAATLSMSSNFDTVAMYLYIAYLLSILLLILIAFLTWYYVAAAVVVLAVVFLSMVTVKYSRWSSIIHLRNNKRQASVYVIDDTVAPSSHGPAKAEDGSDEGDSPSLPSSPAMIASFHNEEIEFLIEPPTSGKSNLPIEEDCTRSESFPPRHRETVPDIAGEMAEEHPNAVAGSRLNPSNLVQIMNSSEAETIYYTSDHPLADPRRNLISGSNFDPDSVVSADPRRHVKIMNSTEGDTIYYSDGKLSASSPKDAVKSNQLTLSPLPDKVAQQHYVKIMESSNVEIIYSSNMNSFSHSSPSVKSIAKGVEHSRRLVLQERRHLVEIMNTSGVEEIITAADIQQTSSKAYGNSLFGLYDKFNREFPTPHAESKDATPFDLIDLQIPDNGEFGDEADLQNTSIVHGSVGKDHMHTTDNNIHNHISRNSDSKNPVLEDFNEEFSSQNAISVGTRNRKEILVVDLLDGSEEKRNNFTERSVIETLDVDLGGVLGNYSHLEHSDGFIDGEDAKFLITDVYESSTDLHGINPCASSPVSSPTDSKGDRYRSLSPDQKRRRRSNTRVHVSLGPGMLAGLVDVPFVFALQGLVESDEKLLSPHGNVRNGPGSQLFSLEN